MRRLLSFPELKTRKGIKYSRQHISRLVKAKKFPAPIKPSGLPTGENAWFDDEIDEHLEERAAHRA
jgi:predicted DNA-binding transcriptional regulator AlpA